MEKKPQVSFSFSIIPVAKVGQTVITNIDVLMFQALESLMTGRPYSSTKEQCVQSLMDQELKWILLGETMEGDVDEKPVFSYIEAMEKDRSLKSGSFREELKNKGISFDFFKKYLLSLMFWQEYLGEKTKDKVDRDRVKKEVEKKVQHTVEDYKEKWSCPYYTVLEISIPVNLKEGSLGKAKAFETMNVILEEMQKNHNTFDMLAKKYSFGFLGSRDGVVEQRAEKDFPPEFIPFLQQGELRKLQFAFLDGLSCLVAYVIVQKIDTKPLLDSLKGENAPGVAKIRQNVQGIFMQKVMDHFAKELLSILRQKCTVYVLYPENIKKI